MSIAFRNVVVTLATQLLSWALTFAVTLFLPRYIGDVGLGKLAFANSVTATFGVVATLGLNAVLIKEIARDRGALVPLMRSAALVRVPFAIGMMALAVLVVFLLGYPQVTCLLVAIAGVSVVIYNANDILVSALLGQEDMPRQSRNLIIEKACSTVILITLVFARAPLWAIAAVSIASGLISLFTNLRAFPHLRAARSEGSSRHLGLAQLARMGLPFLGWALFQTLYGRSDPIVLSLVAGDATVGWYDAGMRLIGSSLFIPNALGAALLPTLNRLYIGDAAQFRQLANRMLALMILCGVPIAAILICIPDHIVALLRYPATFGNSVPVLRVGGVGVMLWFVACALGTTVSAADGQARMCRAAVVASVLGIPWCILSSWVGHRYFGNGAAGAMVSDVVLEAGLVIAYLRMLPPGFFGGESLSLSGRCTLAATPMVLLIVWGAPYWGLWIAIPAVAAYALLCLQFRCIDADHVRLLRSAIGRKVSGSGAVS